MSSCANEFGRPVDIQRDRSSQELVEFRDRTHEELVGVLVARGASRSETENILAKVWADCDSGTEERPSLLEKYSGKCTLQGWLATVATNRWLDFKRRQVNRSAISPHTVADLENYRSEATASVSPLPGQDILVGLLRESLLAAFNRCSARAMVLLRLIYLHGVTQHEIVRMLGWSESKIILFLSRAMHEIESHALSELKKLDPCLELTWEDFVELCKTHQIGFL